MHSKSIPPERWLPMPGYESFYEISDHGGIRALFTTPRHPKIGRTLSPCINNRGYRVFMAIRINGHRSLKMVHRFVAKAFVTNPDNKPFVNHIDSDRTNNHYSNLEWCTQRENIYHKYALGGSGVNKSSRFVGVCFDKVNNKWQAQIRNGKKMVPLGRYKNEQDASNAYEKAFIMLNTKNAAHV